MAEGANRLPSIPPHVREALLECCRARPWVKRLILFGSRARRDEDARSDVDLAVEAPHATQDEWLELHFAIQELETLLKIDLIRLWEAPDDLRRQIAVEGAVVYEQTETPT